MENKDNKQKEALSNFISDDNQNNNKVVLDERTGLIERVDKILVTKEGKQLLREQY